MFQRFQCVIVKAPASKMSICLPSLPVNYLPTQPGHFVHHLHEYELKTLLKILFTSLCTGYKMSKCKWELNLEKYKLAFKCAQSRSSQLKQSWLWNVNSSFRMAKLITKRIWQRSLSPSSALLAPKHRQNLPRQKKTSNRVCCWALCSLS